MSLANAKLRVQAMLRAPGSGEGFTTWMYLDTVSQITIGYGYMMPDAASARSLDLRHPNNRPATGEEKEAEWNRLRALSPAKALLNFSAAHYRKDAKLFIPDDEAQRLLELKLDGFVEYLRRFYPGFDRFPEDAQVGLLDMIYNLGNRLKKKFPNFNKAVNDPKGPDWRKAADRCRRPQLSPARNKDVRDLFLRAAVDAEQRAHGVPGRLVPMP